MNPPTRRRPLVDSTTAWLDAFCDAVRTGDPLEGRHLFAPDASGFGTVASVYRDVNELVEEQWSDVWPRTTEFTVDTVVGRWPFDGGEVVALMWHSMDRDSHRARRGRATILLSWIDGQLVAVHSHFSMLPGTAS